MKKLIVFVLLLFLLIWVTLAKNWNQKVAFENSAINLNVISNVELPIQIKNLNEKYQLLKNSFSWYSVSVYYPQTMLYSYEINKFVINWYVYVWKLVKFSVELNYNSVPQLLKKWEADLYVYTDKNKISMLRYIWDKINDWVLLTKQINIWWELKNIYIFTNVNNPNNINLKLKLYDDKLIKIYYKNIFWYKDSFFF